ncbi:MAG: NlpC/P60 family protein [Elusimicrobiota bacterium]
MSLIKNKFRYFSGMAIFLLFFSLLHSAEFPKKAVVVWPVANIRSELIPKTSDYLYDPLQETQVEKGELIIVQEEKNNWVRVNCLEQIEFTHHSKWEGYPGWVEKAAISYELSHRVRPQKYKASKNEIRQRVLKMAERHLGNRYLWGGRSLFDTTNTFTVTGVDCSGLVNWSFRQLGILIPRDAHEQYMKSKKISPEKLKPGDLIFMAKVDKPSKIVHVMFFENDETIIEAPFSGENVRRISIQERLGKNKAELSNGMRVGERIIYFGTFF